MAMNVDPFSGSSLEDPYRLYERLRHDAPVYQLPETGIWFVTRHDDLVEAASKPEIFSSHISAIVYAGAGTNAVVVPADPDAIGAVDVLATQDPPVHTAQRKLLNRAFVASRMALLEPQIVALLDEKISPPLARGTVEWMEEIANPLPVSMIAGLLGLPQSDLGRLKAWADAGIDLLSGVSTMERMADAWQEMIGFLSYLRERLATPAPESITATIAEAVARGDLSDREGVSLLLQLVIAGSESTAGLLGSAARRLAEDEELQDSLRKDPARIPVFLEESVRLESPFRGHFRVTTRETELGGVKLPEGARVMLMWGSANRDEKAFANAGAVDMEREHPYAHVGFGSGIHFCIGAPLARLEARIVVQALLERTTTFRLSRGAPSPRHVPSVFVRRLTHLHLELISSGDASVA
ncbi:MAG: cytochrome P450 [Actinomycetota bacterium]|nr:cytochrome P450 [Actinomycetota bacterium]